MTLTSMLFFVAASAAAASALGVVLSRNIVRSAVWLLFTLVGVSLLYFLLGADFVGTSQLLVYVGGTLVLVIFGVMLTAQGPMQVLRTRPAEAAMAGLLGVCLLTLLISIAVRAEPLPPHADGSLPSVGPIGLGFLGIQDPTPAHLTGTHEQTRRPRTPVSYLLPFEIVSVHLLVVLIGAAYLARAKRRKA